MQRVKDIKETFFSSREKAEELRPSSQRTLQQTRYENNSYALPIQVVVHYRTPMNIVLFCWLITHWLLVPYR